MTGTAPVAAPNFAASLVHDYAQKLLTVAATWLGAVGVLSPGDQSQFVTLGGSVVLFLLSCAWTYVNARIRGQRLAAAIAAPAAPPAGA